MIERISSEKAKTKKSVILGLDVGTTKVCAIIGEEDENGNLTILGVGSTISQGLKKGIVIDINQTTESIKAAVEKAVRMAGREIKDLLVGIAGGHIQCFNSRASVEIINPEKGVTRSDISRVVQRAKALAMPLDREILHVIPQEYVIDSGPVKNPLGQVTTKLEVNVHIITAAVTSIQNLIRCVDLGGYNTVGILLESIASAHSILTPEDKELGVLLLDIGGGTTDVAIFSRGHVRYSGVVAYGGDNVSADIAYGLKITPLDAENVKKKYGCALRSLVRPEETFNVTQAVSHKQASFNRQFLSEIIEARLEEIFQMVKERITSAPTRDKFFSGVVITGGSALIEGIGELGEKVFECPVRVGFPKGLKGMTGVINSPIYSTGVGLVQHGFSDALNQPPNGKGLFKWVRNRMMRLLVYLK